MRQAGVLAAAGLVALRRGPGTLPEAHANARLLADALAEMPGIAIDPAAVETNIVFFDVSGTGHSAPDFVASLRRSGVLALALGPTRIRLVTHRDVNRSDCELAVAALRSACGETGPPPGRP